MSEAQKSLFEQLGGEVRLRAVLVDFYDQVFADVMIGYLFAGQDKARLIEREFEFTARSLGANVQYLGRGMRAAHAKHPIMRGHFNRRNVLLEQAIDRHGVPFEVKSAWMGHARALMRAIIGTPAALAADCRNDLAMSREALDLEPGS